MALKDLSLSACREYHRAVVHFLAWLEAEHGIHDLAGVTREVVTAFSLGLQQKLSVKGAPYAVSTVNGILAALRFFFSALVASGQLLSDPSSHLGRGRHQERLPRPLKIMDVSRLLASLPRTTMGLRDRALVEILYGTGMRRAELCGLDLSDIDLEQRAISIRCGKGRKDRVVPLGKKAKEVLLCYLDHARPKLMREETRALFLSLEGRRLSPGHVTKHVRTLGQRAGVSVHPHLLRHSCATHLLRGRADIRHIQRLLGHSSLQTTEAYTRVEVSDLREVIQRCHPRERTGQRS
jgi:site-specific recombinase XerD